MSLKEWHFKSVLVVCLASKSWSSLTALFCFFMSFEDDCFGLTGPFSHIPLGFRYRSVKKCPHWTIVNGMMCWFSSYVWTSIWNTFTHAEIHRHSHNTHINTHSRTQSHTFTYSHIHKHIHVHFHVHSHAHTYTLTYTHAHTQNQMLPSI